MDIGILVYNVASLLGVWCWFWHSGPDQSSRECGIGFDILGQTGCVVLVLAFWASIYRPYFLANNVTMFSRSEQVKRIINSQITSETHSTTKVPNDGSTTGERNSLVIRDGERWCP